jgi:hypothetical protein
LRGALDGGLGAPTGFANPSRARANERPCGQDRQASLYATVPPGLVADELPLLVDFRDVCWSPESRWAVDVAFSIVAAGGAYSADSTLAWPGPETAAIAPASL